MTSSASPIPTAAIPSAAPAIARSALDLWVNGEKYALQVEVWTTLLDLLREQLHLSGTKKGCDHGQCGACTVLLNGRRINACLTLAVMHPGARIVTVEGLANRDGSLHPLQQAFLEHDALQCGYCTPGQLCSALGLLQEGQAHSLADVRELMSGNLCRCGAYPQIADAVCQVALGPAACRWPPTQLALFTSEAHSRTPP